MPPLTYLQSRNQYAPDAEHSYYACVEAPGQVDRADCDDLSGDLGAGPFHGSAGTLSGFESMLVKLAF